jgi:O-antigen ligase
MVQTERLPGTWTHAHNAPLELVATVGVVGLAIVAAGLFLLIRGLLRVWWRAVHREGQAAALGALGAVAAALAHECLDFGLTTPANGFTLAILCGVALAVPVQHSSRQARRGRQRSRPAPPAPDPD